MIQTVVFESFVASLSNVFLNVAEIKLSVKTVQKHKVNQFEH